MNTVWRERASKLLYHQLRQSAVAAYIAEIQAAHNIFTDQLDFNNQFNQFYQEIYTSRSSDKIETHYFFYKLEFPTISEQEKDNLDRPLSVKEIQQAITQMRSGKVLGTDGFPVEFYIL